MVKQLVFLIFFYLLISCNDVKYKDQDFKIIEIENQPSSKFMLSDLVKEISYIKLETNNINSIGSIDKLLLSQDRFYIFDSKTMKLAIFDRRGNFISQIANNGRGPGEHQYISDFLIDSLQRRIEYIDLGNRKTIKTDLDGNFISEKPFGLAVRTFSKLNDNCYIYCADNYLNPILYKKQSYNIILLDSNNNLIKSFLPIKELKYLTSQKTNRFVKYSHGVNLTFSWDNSIYYATIDDCQPKYKINFGRNDIPEKLIATYGKIDENDKANLSATFLKMMNEANSKHFVTGIHNIFENNAYLFFQYSLFIPGIKDGTYTVIFNKKTNKIYSGKPENNLDQGLFGEPLVLDGDTLITYFYPFQLLNKIRNDTNILSYNSTKELFKLVESLQEFDNPILAKFILKRF